MTTEQRGAGLGTFAGVFTPSILTILGLVLFLRLGYVVGNVGLVGAIAILALATTVSVLTSLSLATAASNLRVRGGGVYFLISRTLGVEFGGAVGLVLFTAMSVSVAFYSIGLAEALVAILGFESDAAVRLVAAGCVGVLFCFAWLGTDWATRLQYLVMGLLVVALVSFFLGVRTEISAETLADGMSPPDTAVGFWEVFAVFFPAVTGFTQGVAMSGDLRTPSRSIVSGTLLAVGISTAVYLAMMVVLSASLPDATLRAETTTVMGDLSLAPWTAQAGVIAATLSSAMASLLGAPRVMQRVAEDRFVPALARFASGVGPADNPRTATLLSAAIAFAIALIGDVNTVAPVITMFFLATYGLINYATYYEARAASTSFRPTFRWYHPRVSLVGAVACAAAAIAVNPIAGAVAALVLWSLHSYIGSKDLPKRWSDSTQAHHHSEARRHLLALSPDEPDERDWRPCLLVFVPRDRSARLRTLHVTSWFEGASGFVTAVRVIEGSGAVLRRRAHELAATLEHEITEADLPVFTRTVLADDLLAGVQAVVQAHGLGRVRPNTVAFGLRDFAGPEGADQQRIGEVLQECARFSMNVLLIHTPDETWPQLEQTPPKERTIRVWWSEDGVGQLMTLLAWLCTRSQPWSQSPIEVLVPVSASEPSRVPGVRLLLENARISARVVPVDDSAGAMAAGLGKESMALVPLRIRRLELLGPFDTPIDRLDLSRPVTVLVLASQAVDIDAEPDEGGLARHAQAVDNAVEARARANEADAEAARLLVGAEELLQQLETIDPAAEPERHHALSEEVQDVERRAAEAYRRYVQLRVRADSRQREADELDPGSEPELIDPVVWGTSSSDRAQE